nr:hypothetical protein [Kribbella monticola]
MEQEHRRRKEQTPECQRLVVLVEMTLENQKVNLPQEILKEQILV